MSLGGRRNGDCNLQTGVLDRLMNMFAYALGQAAERQAGAEKRLRGQADTARMPGV